VSSGLQVLQRLRDSPPRLCEPVEEQCELCGVDIAGGHGHLVDLDSRTLLCACRGCYLLFTAEGAGGLRYRAVPQEYRRAIGFDISVSQWESLQIPVGVAFFFFNSAIGRVAAFYPGPAGATESELPLAAWEELMTSSTDLVDLRPDVEALLVRAQRGGTIEGFVVPIDACYELVGRLRMSWRGFDGGTEARQHLETFFNSLGERTR
jgi:Family of unknown function (DUF5947)